MGDCAPEEQIKGVLVEDVVAEVVTEAEAAVVVVVDDEEARRQRNDGGAAKGGRTRRACRQCVARRPRAERKLVLVAQARGLGVAGLGQSSVARSSPRRCNNEARAADAV